MIAALRLAVRTASSTHDIVKVQDKTYGLVAFYTAAQIEGLRGIRRREKPKPKRGKGREKAGKAAKATAAPKPKVKAEANDAKVDTATANPDAAGAPSAEQVH